MQKKSEQVFKPSDADRRDMIQYINLQLSALGQPIFIDDEDASTKYSSDKFLSLTQDLINSFREKSRLLSDHLCPADARIQSFIKDYLSDIQFNKSINFPSTTFVLSNLGLAREVSLPPNSDVFNSELVSSYRVKQGILNNPKHDKRTTKGTFHIVRGGLPVPPDKKEVSKMTFAHLLHAALNPSDELKTLPFTSNQEDQAKVITSILLRPIVMPEIKGVSEEKTMEIRFFAPGSLVSNLDFVENIFGNAGDPNLAENDAALDIEHWTGHTGCIMLAPQLLSLTKKEVGLPHYDDATKRQRKDGMCYKKATELYNDGSAFKITCRDERGVVITLIADNYFGYSKKEVKTQISYSANLYGNAEEEHSGGAIAFARNNMMDKVFGDVFSSKLEKSYSFQKSIALIKDQVDIFPEHYAIDKKYPNIVYIPENANMDIDNTSIKWTYDENKEHQIKFSPKKTYIHPSGHKFNLLKHPKQSLWRIVHTVSEGIFLHKPSTVSGGGKSEISKSMENAIKHSTFHIKEIEEDFKMADELIKRDYSTRWKNIRPNADPSRPLLSPKRTLGSTVKLFTPSDLYSDEYNAFLVSIPAHIHSLVLYIKRLYRGGNEDIMDWKSAMSVEVINGRNGNTLLFNNEKVIASYVRIGFSQKGDWLLHKLRSDYLPAQKIQMEDDISATVTVPSHRLKNLNPNYDNLSVKLVENCESHLFQRPDEAIYRGYDVDAESDIVQNNTFLTNYEPLDKQDAIDLYEDTIHFEKYTDPVKNLINKVIAKDKNGYFVTPSHPRIVDGAPTKNPRYLQRNIYKQEREDTYVAEIGIRLARGIEAKDPVYYPVNAVLPGRRNNPSDKAAGIRSLSVYNPIHYQELPELFMDFICSLTGKSPSTTGAGSEGALTKGPFNMLVATTDLNNALLSFILTGYQGFSTAAGYVGTENRFDHDISILVPEIWARIDKDDRDPKVLIADECLEKLEDFDYKGKKVLASRLGYRITAAFAFRCMNRVFDEPLAVFNERMLKPELQSMEDFVDGINNITEVQEKVALSYFEDGSIEACILPLKILIHIMAYGKYEGKDISSPELRKYFERDYVINSDWYKARLKLKQDKDVAFHQKQIVYLKAFIAKTNNAELVEKMDIQNRLNKVQTMLYYSKSSKYLKDLVGTIGADPLFK